MAVQSEGGARSEAIVEVRDAVKIFGSFKALNRVSLAVEKMKVAA